MEQPILYYSTNLNAPLVAFQEALLQGQAPDRGLYLPQTLPTVSPEELRGLARQPYSAIAYVIAQKFLRREIADAELRAMVTAAYDFPVPLERVAGRQYVLRLDQGPTASFKDFAARLMGRLMQHFLRQERRHLLILTATSGDTGSAIANAFYGLDNIAVVILFPEQEVTARQRQQMTTLGQNIRTIALHGKFDDCQALVKQAFADPDLAHLQLSSANSINIGRLLPQMIYYFYAFAQLQQADAADNAIFAVPSGNFGDLMGGLLAQKMGLPVKKFVVATNANDEFPIFLASRNYAKIVPSRNCISSAMNVGHPSNVARLVALYGGQMDEQGRIGQTPDFEQMRRDMYAVSISDAETQATIKQAYQAHKLLLEPHGAVAWAGLQHYLAAHPADNTPNQLCIAFETAHPAKFPQAIQALLGFDPALPPSLAGLEAQAETFARLPPEYAAFKSYLQDNY